MKLDTFTQAYIEAALWSSTDDDREPLDSLYGIEDIATDTLKEIIADCQDFQDSFGEMIADSPERAGHDFWLTRNRHGAGFWDGDWPQEVGKHLTDMSHPYGEVNLYVGDDGLIYSM